MQDSWKHQQLKGYHLDIINIGIDTMVLDKKDANLREGVERTYK